jgi:carbon-monoxide dehydrogenase medium subunit
VIPGEFEYHAPRSLADAVKLLAGADGTKVLAGGMSLIPAVKHRLATPRALVDLARVPGLEGIEERRGRLAFGARVTHAAIARARELFAFPILAETARVIGDPQVRNRGTLAGSLVHADPAADWPAVFLALSGEVTAVGPRGERTIPAAQFFASMLTSAVRADEIVTEVRLAPERSRAGAAYEKLRQPASGFAIVGVAAQVVLDRRGRCEAASVAVTGANPVPFRAESLEARLRGAEPSQAALRDACARVEEVDPLEDIHASADYRRHLVSVLARRALLRAAERARA